MALSHELVEQIKENDIAFGGEERRKEWEEGRIRLDLLEEEYNYMKTTLENRKLKESGQPEKPIPEQPIFKSIMKEFDKKLAKYKGNVDLIEQALIENEKETNRGTTTRAIHNHFFAEFKKRKGNVKND
jgi:hypothetical protein